MEGGEELQSKIIKLFVESSSEKNDAQTHLLPCAIKSNGAAPVSQYFVPEETDRVIDGKTVRCAALRGRELKGATLDLPGGYTGFVLERSTSGSDIAWSAQASFQRFTYWQHDVEPTAADVIPRAMEWGELSKQVHAPITKAEMEAMMAN